jgi:hypothetical protein
MTFPLKDRIKLELSRRSRFPADKDQATRFDLRQDCITSVTNLVKMRAFLPAVRLPGKDAQRSIGGDVISEAATDPILRVERNRSLQVSNQQEFFMEA